MKITNTQVTAVSCAAWLALGACGGAAMPARERTSAIAAVRSARELGAQNNPDASFHLALADEGVAQAEAHVVGGRMVEAQRLFVRASVDAELAMALQREADARAGATESHRHIEAQRGNTLQTDRK